MELVLIDRRCFESGRVLPFVEFWRVRADAAVGMLLNRCDKLANIEEVLLLYGIYGGLLRKLGLGHAA